MFYLIFRDGSEEISKTLVQEVDHVFNGSDPLFGTHKKQRFAEAWYGRNHVDASQKFAKSNDRNTNQNDACGIWDF